MVIQTEIAVVFDFDITVSPGYMQEPIFEHFDLDEVAVEEFWRDEVAGLLASGFDAEHAYLYALIRRFPRLSNTLLAELGRELSFFPGFPDVIDRLKSFGAEPQYAVGEEAPHVETYIVSSGLEEMIRGCPALQGKLKQVWACRLAEEVGQLKFPMETVSHTTKTQKLFLINKGLLNRADTMCLRTGARCPLTTCCMWVMALVTFRVSRFSRPRAEARSRSSSRSIATHTRPATVSPSKRTAWTRCILLTTERGAICSSR